MRKKFIIFIAALLIITTTIGTSQKVMKVMAATDESENTIVMDKPPFKYYVSDNAVSKKNKPIQLKVKSSKTNNIVDDEDWFRNNKLSMKTYEVPNPFVDTEGNLPDAIPATWMDLIITSSFYDASYIYCTYGSDFSEGYILNIYSQKNYKLAYSLDFSSYRYAPKYIKADYDYIQQTINWATIKNNVLYIANSHCTYAKSSRNMNGYITAIDLEDMSIIWRSKSLVSNAFNFLIVDDVILCGYGFTAEPDYLYQLDLNTGKVLKRTLLKSAISYIMKKGSVLYVRTYNTDYKFDMIQ